MTIYISRIPLTDEEIEERRTEEAALAGVRSQHCACASPKPDACDVAYDACGTPLYTITATERDPYYIDDLAKAVQNGNGRNTIRVTVDGNIPIIRNVGHKGFVYPGYDGIPDSVRSDHAFRYLADEPVNVVSTIPQYDGLKRVVGVIERSQEFARWFIIESEIQSTPPPARLTPAYFPRGRGAAPWWKTQYPNGSPSSGTTT